MAAGGHPSLPVDSRRRRSVGRAPRLRRYLHRLNRGTTIRERVGITHWRSRWSAHEARLRSRWKRGHPASALRRGWHREHRSRDHFGFVGHLVGRGVVWQAAKEKKRKRVGWGRNWQGRWRGTYEPSLAGKGAIQKKVCATPSIADVLFAGSRHNSPSSKLARSRLNLRSNLFDSVRVKKKGNPQKKREKPTARTRGPLFSVTGWEASSVDPRTLPKYQSQGGSLPSACHRVGRWPSVAPDHCSPARSDVFYTSPQSHTCPSIPINTRSAQNTKGLSKDGKRTQHPTCRYWARTACTPTEVPEACTT